MEFAEKIHPRHTAFLVIDVQREYFNKDGIIDLLGYDYKQLRTMIDPLNHFLKEARNFLGRVIFTQDIYQPHKHSAVLQEHYHRAKMERPYNPQMEEFYRISPAPTDIVLTKYRYSAFFETELDDFLRTNGIKTIILSGVATNVCVESTARDGFMLDYHVIVVSDLTTGVESKAHQMSLFNINQFFGEVVSSQKIVRTWKALSPTD